MRRLLPVVLCCALLAGCSDDEPRSAAPSRAEAEKALAGSPPPLAAIHEQSNELLDGGPEAFEERLAELKGFPIVVNMWGSWCGPCRREFPHFQEQAIAQGKEVAFLGVNGSDPEKSAAKFLAQYPVAFPHYTDPDLKIARVIKAINFPSTVFYDRKGRIAHLKQGPYRSDGELAADIERYAR